VFEVLKTRRPLQLAARSAILVAVSPVLFVASGIRGDKVGVAVALLLAAVYLLVDRDAPLVAAWVPSLAWGWDSLKGDPGGGSAPGGLGPGWALARPVDQGLAGWLLGSGRPLVLAAAVVPAVLWVRHRSRRVYAAVGLLLLAPWPWPRPGRRGTWSGRPCSATWGTPAGPASTPSPPGRRWAGPRPGGGAAAPGPPGSPPAPSPTAPSPALA